MSEKIHLMGDVFLPKSFSTQVDFDKYVFNLEYPITKETKGYAGKINLKSEKSFIFETFKKLPIAVCLANNHIMDYGSEGLIQTMQFLNNNKIGYFGAGKLNDNCNNPYIIKNDSIKIAFLGYIRSYTNGVIATEQSAGARLLEMSVVSSDILSCKKAGVDRIIVYIHWGIEEFYLPLPIDIKIAHDIIDNGADLIVGQHAHCIQPYEKYKKSKIFYGIGNCIMPDLAVPCNYNDFGVSTTSFIKKQATRNKQSICIGYDPLKNNASIEFMEFNKSTLIQLDGLRRNICLSIKNRYLYLVYFELYYLFWLLRRKMISLLRNPRIPKMKNVIESFKKI